MQEKYYTFLTKQHIGAPAGPVVRVGELVRRGQCIAGISEGQLGTDIHSSVDGVVDSVSAEAIRIRAAEKQSTSYLPLEGETVLQLIRNSGLAGMGGAGFPTYQKLLTPLGDSGMVIVNAAECEPLLNHNIKRILTDPEKVVRGVEITMEAVGAAKGVIAIKEKHHEAVAALKKVLADKKIEIYLLSDYYPMGEERAVIREVTGKLLEVNQLPSKAGIAVLNVETVYRIMEAVELRKPVMEKDITIAGRINGKQRIQVIQDVPVGLEAADLIEQAGGLMEDVGELIMGGPFTGKRLQPQEPITKTSGGILAAMPFIKESRRLGLLVCACGATRERMEQIAESMEAQIAGIEYCKQAVGINGNYKCENPGKCPGQSQKVLALKKKGAEALLIGNCTDCTNTVMSLAPALHMPVHHITDGALRAAGEKLIRKNHLT